MATAWMKLGSRATKAWKLAASVAVMLYVTLVVPLFMGVTLAGVSRMSVIGESFKKTMIKTDFAAMFAAISDRFQI